MKLNAKITGVDRDKERGVVISGDIEGGGYFFKWPNADALQLDDELVVLVTTKACAASIANGIGCLIAGSSVAYGADLADFLDQLRPDESLREAVDDLGWKQGRCVAVCDLSDDIEASNHHCLYGQGHTGQHRFSVSCKLQQAADDAWEKRHTEPQTKRGIHDSRTCTAGPNGTRCPVCVWADDTGVSVGPVVDDAGRMSADGDPEGAGSPNEQHASATSALASRPTT